MRFFRLHICINTHLPHFDALTHMLIHVSLAFIFQTFAEVCYSVFVKRSSFKSLLNLCKVYIFQEFAEGLLSICVCWIFQNVHLSKVSAAVVPQSKSTKLCTCSLAVVVPQSKSTKLCTCSLAVVVKSSHSTKLLHFLRRTIRYH